MTDRDALIAAIAADPDDDLPRLVFADWLEERGEAGPAEFLRTHVRFARMSAADPEFPAVGGRVRELFAAHWRELVGPVCAAFDQPPPRLLPEAGWRKWLATLRNVEAVQWTVRGRRLRVPCDADYVRTRPDVPLKGVEFARGLVAKLQAVVFIRTGRWFERAFRLCPVTNLHMSLRDPLAWPQATRPFLRRVRDLTVVYADPRVWHLGNMARDMFRDPNLEGVTRLHLGAIGNALAPGLFGTGTHDLNNLIASPMVTRVQALRVHFGQGAVYGLAGYPAGSPLAELTGDQLYNPTAAPMAAADWRMLAETPVRPQLLRLGLASCLLDDEALGALARGPRWDRLAGLKLDDNRIGDDGLAEFARSGITPALRVLHLTGNQVGDAGATALARSPLSQRLHVLDLADNRVSGAGAARLAAALAEGPLRLLRLGGNPLSRGEARRVREILGKRVTFGR